MKAVAEYEPTRNPQIDTKQYIYTTPSNIFIQHQAIQLYDTKQYIYMTPSNTFI